MTDKEILDKAIELTKTNGCKMSIIWSNELYEAVEDVYEPSPPDYYHFIFDHDFAKALWGEDILKPIDPDARSWRLGDLNMAQPAFKYHLQQMVVAEDPIKYLGENI